MSEDAVTVREACRLRQPLDGADAQALEHALAVTERQRDEARATLAEASRMWDGPATADWLDEVSREAAHQVARWGKAHDAAKSPEDFFWLLGYLAGKALASARAGDTEKALHHTISSGAVLLNWHARLRGEASLFQPGAEPGSE